jgi:glycosyltransferase involved in cell wall biosynthesis
MRVVVSSEYHMYRAPDGGLYTEVLCVYKYWARLLRVFDEVQLLVRVRDAPLPAGARRVDGPGVSAIPVRDFVAGRGLIPALPSLARAAYTAARTGDAFILHAPGVMATALREALRFSRSSYGIEIVGDPTMSLDGNDRLLSRLRHVGAAAMREQAWNATVAKFVTVEALQRLYPANPQAWQIVASDVEIPDELFDRPAVPVRDSDVLDLGFIGTLQRPYKGLDVLIDALAQTELPHRLAVVGDGMLRPGLEERARQRGIAERIEFRGFLPPPAIFDYLVTRDAMVQPSRTEGMPRVLIEAMSVGLPCLATPVGGVPELLAPSEIVPVDDPAALAKAIDALARDRLRRHELVEANRKTAWGYRTSEGERRLLSFYEAVRDRSGRKPRIMRRRAGSSTT